MQTQTKPKLKPKLPNLKVSPKDLRLALIPSFPTTKHPPPGKYFPNDLGPWNSKYNQTKQKQTQTKPNQNL